MKERPALHSEQQPAPFFCSPKPIDGSETAFCSFDVLAKYLSQILSAQQV
jgi:hypothetical protein